MMFISWAREALAYTQVCEVADATTSLTLGTWALELWCDTQAPTSALPLIRRKEQGLGHTQLDQNLPLQCFSEIPLIQVLQWQEECCYVFFLSPLRAIYTEHSLLHYSCYTEKNVPNLSPLDSVKSLFHYHPDRDMSQNKDKYSSFPSLEKLNCNLDVTISSPGFGQCDQRKYVAILICWLLIL